MKLISFDVGIRNMAYCIFNISDISNNVSIIDWNIINLMDVEPDIKKCNILLKSKGKPNSKTGKSSKSGKNNNTNNNRDHIETECGKKAKYEKNEICFCEKHAKTSNFLMPIKECSPTNLKKLKIGELQDIAVKYKIDISSITSKKIILETLLTFFSNQCIAPIFIKKKSANDLDLISIGKNLKKELNLIDEIRTVTNIIIENQISPIANRMKTIQGMLAQYFIMNENDNVSIEFLSAAGKLKGLEKQNENLVSEYKQHKKDAIFYCTKFLEKENFRDWTHILDNKKKDDLADCFLQGIWYLQSKNNISCV